MQGTRGEIDAAIESLQLPTALIRALPDVEAESVFQRALDRFVVGGDRRWWWESFSEESVSRHVNNGWRLLATLTPDPKEHVWFVAEDDQLPFYPLFDATPEAAEQIIGECFGFEYYLIAKDMTWLLCENHHDYLIAVGEPVVTRLSQMTLYPPHAAFAARKSARDKESPEPIW